MFWFVCIQNDMISVGWNIIFESRDVKQKPIEVLALGNSDQPCIY